MNHLVFPVQLALIVVFLGAGDRVFHMAAHTPMTRDAFTRALKAHDWAMAHTLWTWEWHALVVWLVVATVLTPLVAMALRPLLEALLRGLKDQPIVEK
jgi:choline-glycine betaine transporter